MSDREGPFWDAVAGKTPPPPSAALLGWRALEAEPGHVRIQFQAREEFSNYFGVIQGGFLAAMLDDTLGPAVVSAIGPEDAVATIEIKVSYLRPAKAGTMIGDARVVHQGRSVVFVEGTLENKSGDIVARATGTWRVMPGANRSNDDRG